MARRASFSINVATWRRELNVWGMKGTFRAAEREGTAAGMAVLVGI